MRPWEREQQDTPPPASSPPSSSPVQVKVSVSSLVIKPSDSVSGGGGSDFEPGEVRAADSRRRDEFPSSPIRPRSQRFLEDSGNGICAGSVSPTHQRRLDRYDPDIDHSEGQQHGDIDHSEGQQHGREFWGGKDSGKFRDLSPTYGHGRGGKRNRDLSPINERGRGGEQLRDLSPTYGRGRDGDRFRDLSPTFGWGRGRGRFRDLSPPYGRGRGGGRFRDPSPPYGRGRGGGRFRDLSPPYGRGRGGGGRFRALSPTYRCGRYRDFPPPDEHGRFCPGGGEFREPSPPYGRGKGGGRFRDLSPQYEHGRGGRSLDRGFDERPLSMRGESIVRNDPNLAPRVGDWICRDPLCGNLNFARRDYCNNCNKFRYGPGDGGPTSSPRRSYSGPPPLHGSPPRRSGPPVERALRRDTNGYRSPPHGWAREGPRDLPSPRHGGRVLDRQIRRGRPDYDDEVDCRERSKFDRPMPYELDGRDHQRDEFISQRRDYDLRPPSPHDRWVCDSRERSRSPMRDRPLKHNRRGSFMGRARGVQWGRGRGRNDIY